MRALASASTGDAVADPTSASDGGTTVKIAALWRTTATPPGVVPVSTARAWYVPAAAGISAPA